MTKTIRGKTVGSLLMIIVIAASLVSAPIYVAAVGIAVSPATPVARALLNMAILPPNAALVHPVKAVVCKCAQPLFDSKYLVTMHRFYEVPGTPSSVEEFLATHVPKGGVEGQEGQGGAVLENSTAFPANGPHIYLRQLAYSITSRNASTSWLRIDSLVTWVPSRSSSQVLTGALSASATGYRSVGFSGSSGATKVHVSGRNLTHLLHALNSLPLGPQFGCEDELNGFLLHVELKNGVTVQVYNNFCGGPSDLVAYQIGNTPSTRYFLSDTSCALVKDVVSLFGSAPVAGTRNALRSCEAWVKHPVA
jgi:hypothetical protein